VEKTIHVREAQTEDVNQISFVIASSWKSAYRGIIDDDYLDLLRYDRWAGFLAAELSGDRYFSMVLLEDEEIIGAAILGKTESMNKILLVSFYLMPSKISQGYGRIFYHEIENEVKKRGYTKCILDVLETNSRAIRFYEANSFVDLHTKKAIVLGDKSYVCKVFEKDLL